MNPTSTRPRTWRRIVISFTADLKLVITFAILALAYLVCHQLLGDSAAFKGLGEFADAVVKLCTLGIAFLVWQGEAYNEWEERLPKQLFVEYRLNGNPVLRAEQITLLDEGDMRAWAQQIGQQMAGAKLNFSLNVTHWTHIYDAPANAAKYYVLRYELNPDHPTQRSGGALPTPLCRYPANEAPATRQTEAPKKPKPDLLKIGKEGDCLYLNPNENDEERRRPVRELQPLPGDTDV